MHIDDFSKVSSLFTARRLIEENIQAIREEMIRLSIFGTFYSLKDLGVEDEVKQILLEKLRRDLHTNTLDLIKLGVTGV